MITVALPLPPRETLEARYGERTDAYAKLLYELQRRVQTALVHCGLRATIKHRVKSFQSLHQKLLRLARAAEPDTGSVTVTDLIGIRIVCPFLEDVAIAERCMRAQFHIHEVDRKGAQFSVREFGYESIHCLMETPADVLESFHLAGPFDCEVQIRTILQDAWAEVEHELVYKSEFTPFDNALQRKLAALNANLSLSDITFQEIRTYQRSLHAELQKRRSRFWESIQRATGDGPDLDAIDELLEAETVTAGVSPALSAGTDEASDGGGVGPRTEWSDSAGGLDSLLLDGLRAHNAGDYERALEIYTQILAARPQTYVRAVVLIHRGMARFASAHYRDSISDMDEALELDSGNWRALFYRGTAFRVLGDIDRAAEDFERCLMIDPYRIQRSTMYLQAGRLEDAETDCERARGIRPDAEAVLQLSTAIAERKAYANGNHTKNACQ